MPSSLAEEWQYRVDLVDRSLAVRREADPRHRSLDCCVDYCAVDTKLIKKGQREFGLAKLPTISSAFLCPKLVGKISLPRVYAVKVVVGSQLLVRICWCKVTGPNNAGPHSPKSDNTASISSIVL